MSEILAAIDDSAAATPVLHTALALAPVMDSTVQALHVAAVPGRTASACATSCGVPLRTVPGDPLTEIRRSVEAENVAAVVVGARDRATGRHQSGHIPLALASSTAKPVIVVPPTSSVPEVLHRVLIAVEGTPRRARALQRAVELARGADLELTVVHVDDENSIPRFSDQVHHETKEYANEFLVRYAPGAPDARLQLRIGDPADEILAAVDELDVELLAIGWPHSDDPTRGVVARELVERSRVPVLLVALANRVG